jgi:hypothetical protein
MHYGIAASMKTTPRAAETSRVQLLCRLIQKETEPRKFSKLVRELDQLLSKKEDRLNQEQPLSPQAHHSP